MADGTRRILFITLSNIGDLVLTTPALEALHAAYPDHAIDIVADPRSSELLRACPYLGTLHHRDKSRGWRGMLALVRALRRVRYTAVVDLRTDFVPWLLRSQRRAARWHRPSHGQHASAQHLAIVSRVLPAGFTVPPPRVWIQAQDTEFAREALASIPAKRWLAVAPGANWPGKIWPLNHYVELARRLSDLCDGLLVLGGPGDRVLAVELAERARMAVCDLAGRTTLCQAAALLDLAAVFVGNDSGLGHMAAARGIPTLTLFGPGRPERYRPLGARARMIEAPGGVLPALSPAVVETAVREMLVEPQAH